MDSSNTLHPSVQRFLTGQDRLKVIRLRAYMGEGLGIANTPMIEVGGNGGSYRCGAHGIPLDALAAACEAFNSTLAAVIIPTTADYASERRRRTRIADAVGDRVREMVLEALSQPDPIAADVMTERDPVLDRRAAYLGSCAQERDEADRQAEPVA